MDRTAFPLILVSVILSAAAQVALKAGMISPAIQQSVGAAVATRIVTILTNPMVLLGLFFYGASAAVWLLVLQKIPVSTAYPFVALGIVLTAIAGRLVFDDPFSAAKIAGTLLIVGGVVVLARA